MKKICTVCGYAIENTNIRECPNCGSYDFKTIQPEKESERIFKRW